MWHLLYRWYCSLSMYTHTHASHIMCRNYGKLPPEYCSVLCKCVAFFSPLLFPLGEKSLYLYWDTFVLQVVGLITIPYILFEETASYSLRSVYSWSVALTYKYFHREFSEVLSFFQVQQEAHCKALQLLLWQKRIDFFLLYSCYKILCTSKVYFSSFQ